MKNAAFPDQIGGCEKSMHYPDDPKKLGFSRKPLQILHSSFIIHHSSLIISSISASPKIPSFSIFSNG